MIKLAVTFDNFSPRKDRSVGLRFITMTEVSSEFYTTLADNVSLSGWLVFDDIATIEAPKERLPDREQSPSKRLRNKLYVKWEKMIDLCATDVSFDRYYEMYYLERDKELSKDLNDLDTIIKSNLD